MYCQHGTFTRGFCVDLKPRDDVFYVPHGRGVYDGRVGVVTRVQGLQVYIEDSDEEQLRGFYHYVWNEVERLDADAPRRRPVPGVGVEHLEYRGRVPPDLSPPSSPRLPTEVDVAPSAPPLGPLVPPPKAQRRAALPNSPPPVPKYDAEAVQGGVDEDELTECPITGRRCAEPVIASDGFTYERAALLERWNSGDFISPKTSKPFPNLRLCPNNVYAYLLTVSRANE